MESELGYGHFGMERKKKNFYDGQRARKPGDKQLFRKISPPSKATNCHGDQARMLSSASSKKAESQKGELILIKQEFLLYLGSELHVGKVFW